MHLNKNYIEVLDFSELRRGELEEAEKSEAGRGSWWQCCLTEDFSFLNVIFLLHQNENLNFI